jgi:hypothetical protein
MIITYGIGILLISRGAVSWSAFEQALMLVLAALFLVSAFVPGTRISLGMSHGRRPGVPISKAGRVILILIAVVLFLAALGWL